MLLATLGVVAQIAWVVAIAWGLYTAAGLYFDDDETSTETAAQKTPKAFAPTADGSKPNRERSHLPR